MQPGNPVEVRAGPFKARGAKGWRWYDASHERTSECQKSGALTSTIRLRDHAD